MFTLQIKLFLVSAFELPKLFGLGLFFFFFTVPQNLLGHIFMYLNRGLKTQTQKNFFSYFLCATKLEVYSDIHCHK